MSTATEQLRERWGRKRFQRAMQQQRSMMEQHLDKMESENGMLAMLMVSGIAQLVAHGQESQSALDATIKHASELSGIPQDALAAHARFTSEMVKCFTFDQQQEKARVDARDRKEM